MGHCVAFFLSILKHWTHIHEYIIGYECHGYAYIQHEDGPGTSNPYSAKVIGGVSHISGELKYSSREPSLRPTSLAVGSV